MMTEQHYRWDSKHQCWKPDGAEIAIVVGATALFVGLLALVLLTLR
jgi:hypothetical protein